MLLVELSTNETENGFKGSIGTYLENGAKQIFRLRVGFTTESKSMNSTSDKALGAHWYCCT